MGSRETKPMASDRQSCLGVTAVFFGASLLMSLYAAQNSVLPAAYPSTPSRSKEGALQCETPLRTSLALKAMVKRDETWSRCTDWTWLDAVDPWNGRQLVYVDIGCSLGYGVARVFGHKAPELGLNPSSLHGFLTALNIGSCGQCGDCRGTGGSGARGDVPVAAYCVDAAPRNMRVMSKAAQHFVRRQGPGRLTPHSLTVRNAYVTRGNATSVSFPALCIGERCSLYSAAAEGVQATVPVAGVDALAEEYGWDYVDVLKVSVGGDEPAVAHSALRLLRSRRIGVLVLDYSHAGLWEAEYTLKDVLSAVEYFGYKCYLGTKSGYIPLTECFVETYAALPSAQVVCTRYDPRVLGLDKPYQ